MHIYLECKDNHYRKAIIAYYKKYYLHKVDLVFSYHEHALILRDYTDYFQTERKHLKIRKYQHMEIFFEKLCTLEFDILDGKPFEVISMSSFFSACGTTILSLNMAKMLSQSKSTLWFSLEKLASTPYYDIQNSLSTTDLFFYMDHNPMYLKNTLKTESLTLIRGVEYYSDLDYVSKLEFDLLLDFLQELGYERIVVDCGDLHHMAVDHHYYVIEDNKRMFLKTKQALSTFKRYPILINKRKHDVCVDLMSIKDEAYYYIDYQTKLRENIWAMNPLQNRLKEILNIR